MPSHPGVLSGVLSQGWRFKGDIHAGTHDLQIETQSLRARPAFAALAKSDRTSTAHGEAEAPESTGTRYIHAPDHVADRAERDGLCERVLEMEVQHQQLLAFAEGLVQSEASDAT